VTVGHFEYKLAAIHIMYAVCTQTSVLTYVTCRDLVRVEHVKCTVLRRLTLLIFLRNVKQQTARMKIFFKILNRLC
jgi:hypothetical protein